MPGPLGLSGDEGWNRCLSLFLLCGTFLVFPALQSQEWFARSTVPSTSSPAFTYRLSGDVCQRLPSGLISFEAKRKKKSSRASSQEREFVASQKRCLNVLDPVRNGSEAQHWSKPHVTSYGLTQSLQMSEWSQMERTLTPT
ncbi:hypothetical protein BJX64DRAFT_19735 [Aspergillus heterothallicus]